MTMRFLRIGALAAVVSAVLASGFSAAQKASQFPQPEALLKVIMSDLEAIRPLLTAPEGSVVAIKNGAVYLSNDTGAAVAEGSELTIVREKEIITHPVTGERLGAITDTVAMVNVVSANNKLIVAKPVSVKEPIREGDRIGRAYGRKKKVAVVISASLKSWSPPELADKVWRGLASWRDVSLTPPYSIERFIYDEGIDDLKALSSPEIHESLRNRLKVDYLVFMEINETGDAVLDDIVVFDLVNGTQMAARKGIYSKKPEAPATPARLAPPERKTPASIEQAQARRLKESLLKPGDRARSLGRFKGRIAALMAEDLDGDGTVEIVIGFDHKVAAYKLDDGKLVLSWEVKIGSGNQITGLCAGDFNGNGKPEIYVSGARLDKVRSLILEGSDSGPFKILRKDLGYLFYKGADGGLYGQRQEADLGLETKILSLEWSDSGFSEKTFMDIPAKSRLSGIAIVDIDGDGTMDVAGFDYQHSLVYYSSSAGDWSKTSGRFGGSNITITLSSYEDTDTYHEFQPPITPLPDAGGRPDLLAANNHAATYLTAPYRFTTSQVTVLEHDGMSYFTKKQTPIAPGVINGTALLSKNTPNLILMAKTRPSMIGADDSEVVLLDIDRY